MSTLPGLPDTISDELKEIASHLSNAQKRAIRRDVTTGHTWKSILMATQQSIQGSSRLSQKEKKSLLNRCFNLQAKALQQGVKENTPLDLQTYHKIIPEESISEAASQKTKHAAGKTLQPTQAPSPQLDNIFLGFGERMLMALKSTSELPPAPQNLGLSDQAVSTLQKSIRLMLQYTCQHLVRYENGKEEPPRFIKPFFIEKRGHWVLNETGSSLKKSLLTGKAGSPTPDEKYLTGLSSTILTNIYTLAGNFKKASEEGFSLPPQLETALQKAFSPPKAGEERPSLQSISEQLTGYFLKLILPGKSKDIKILSGLDTIVYTQIEKKVRDGFYQALCKLESIVKPSKEPVSAQEPEKTEEVPEDESLADLISETIFPQNAAVELNSLIGNIPGITKLPGFSSLQAAQKDRLVPTTISKTPLTSVIGEVATTTILGALPKEYYKETIASTKTRLEQRGISHPEVVGKTFAIMLEKMKSALVQHEDNTSPPPTLFLKLFSLDSDGKYHKNALGSLLLPILQDTAAKEALTTYVEAASLHLIDSLCSKIAAKDLSIPKELLSQDMPVEERAEAVTGFLLNLLDLDKIPLPPLFKPLQPFLRGLAADPLKKQVIPLLRQMDTQFSAILEGKAAQKSSPPTALTAVAELDILPQIPELLQFGGTLASVLLNGILFPTPVEQNEAAIAKSKEELKGQGFSQASVNFPSVLFTTMLDFTREALENPKPSPPPAPLGKLFSQNSTTKLYEPTSEGKLLLALLQSGNAEKNLTTYLESASLSMIQMICEKVKNGEIQLPAALLAEGELTTRSEYIAKFLLETFPMQDLPLPPLLEPLKGSLSALVKAPFEHMLEGIIPKLDAAIKALPEKLIQKQKASVSQPPSFTDMLIAIPGAAEFGGALAGVLLKGALPLKPPEPTELNTALNGVSTAFLTYLKDALKKTYSEKNLPPESLKALFDDQYHLNQLGQFMNSLLDVDGADQAIGDFVTTTLSSCLTHFKNKAHLQIPKELINLKAKDSDRAQKITLYLLDLVLDKEDIQLPPMMESLRGPLYGIISTIVKKQVSVRLSQFDALLKPTPIKAKTQEKQASLDPATAKLVEEVEKYLPDIGSFIGQAVLHKAITELHTSLETNIKTKKKALKGEYHFSEQAVDFPNKLLSDLVNLLQKELRTPRTPPPTIFKGLFSKTDGTYVRNPMGETLVRLLETEENKQFIVTLLEDNLLSILTNICSQKLNPEALLDKLAQGFSSLSTLLSSTPAEGKAKVEEPSFTELAPILQSSLKQVLPSLKIFTLPFVSPEIAPQLENMMINLFGQGIQAALQIADDNIPTIVSYLLEPPPKPEKGRILPFLTDQIKKLRHQRQYPRTKLKPLTHNAYLALHALFPEVRLPEFLIKAIVKMSINYIEIPPQEILSTILTTASIKNFSIEAYLFPPSIPGAAQNPPEEGLEELNARQFIRKAIRAQKTALKEKLQEIQHPKTKEEIKQAKNTFWHQTRLRFKIFWFGFFGHVLPYLLVKPSDTSVTQRIQNVIIKLRELRVKSPSL